MKGRTSRWYQLQKLRFFRDTSQRSMKKLIPVLLLILLFQAGCVSNGFRVTERESKEFTFEGELVDGNTLTPAKNVKIEIYTWYQPIFATMSYKKLGEVVTSKEGMFSFNTRELELILVVEGCLAFNHYGSEPFNPKEYQKFIIREEVSPESWKRMPLRHIEPADSGNG